MFGLNRLPASFPVAFAIMLRFPEAEAGQPVELQLVVRGPNLETVGEPTSFEITAGLGEHHAPGWEGTFTVAGAVRLLIALPGAHSISIQIAGAEAGVIPFQAVLAAG